MDSAETVRCRGQGVHHSRARPPRSAREVYRRQHWSWRDGFAPAPTRRPVAATPRCPLHCGGGIFMSDQACGRLVLLAVLLLLLACSGAWPAMAAATPDSVSRHTPAGQPPGGDCPSTRLVTPCTLRIVGGAPFDQALATAPRTATSVVVHTATATATATRTSTVARTGTGTRTGTDSQAGTLSPSPTRTRIPTPVGTGSFLHLNGQPGDYILGDQERQFTLANATFSNLHAGRGQVGFNVDSSAGDSWTVGFVAPPGQIITVGTYTKATRAFYGETNEPSLGVSGEHRGCNQVTGSFVIRELVMAPDSTVFRFQASFEQHCEGAIPALFGEIRYVSPAPTPTPLATPVGNGSFLLLDSQPGDYIGAGQLLLFTPRDSTFGILPSTSRAEFFVSQGGIESWDVEFAAPDGHILVPGAYEGAKRYHAQGPGEPGLNVSGEARGCNTLTGRFVVLDSDFAADGTILRFDATFEQHCEGGPFALSGEIRFTNTSIPTATPTPTATRTASPAPTVTRTLGPTLTNTVPPSPTAVPFIGSTPPATPAALTVSQALALVQLSGQQGMPCATRTGEACRVSGTVQGSGTIAGSMAWQLTAAVPSTVVPGTVPVVVVSTVAGLQGFPCIAWTVGSATVTCVGTTTANALQGSVVTVVFLRSLVAVGTVSGPGAIAAGSVATLGVPAALPLLPPPILLPLPPVPLSPSLPARASVSAVLEVPIIPEASSIALLISGLTLLAGGSAIRRRR
jgi:hypothetical protein